MKLKRGKSAEPARVFPALVMAATVAVAMYISYGNGSYIGAVREKAALLSAALNMPDTGFGILGERFKSELYGAGENNALEDSLSWPPGQVMERIGDKPEIPEPEAPSLEEASSGNNTEEAMPPIPEKYAAPLVSENFAGYEGADFVKYGEGYIRNDTKLSNAQVENVLDGDFPIEFDTDGPQVLIVHTHATESYEKYDRDIYDTRNTWRSTDNSNNMAAVGNAMREVLELNGIGVIHDTTQHDYPSYNGSYERSAKTIKEWLEEYPGIKVVLDLHRDAMERDDAIVKPVASIAGKKAAQIMIIAACDDGTVNVPEWRENLRFAAAFQNYMESSFPMLTKPVYLCYRKYNMDLTTGSLLLEFGSNANTLEEAVYSARMAGEALSRLIWDHTA